MQHALVVCRGKSRAQFARDLDRFVSGQASDAEQQAAEVFPIHIFHRKERGAVDFADIVNAADVGMRNLARDAHFGVGAREQSGRKQLQVARAINFAHAALPDESDDAVALGEHGAGGNRPSSDALEAIAVVAGGIASVGTWDADPSAAPQTPQKWFQSGFSAVQERHRAIETHSMTGAMPVVASGRSSPV